MLSTLYVKLISGAALVLALWAGYSYVTGLQDKVATLGKDNAVLVEKLNTCSGMQLALKKTAEARVAAHAAQLKEAEEANKKALAKAKNYYTAKPSTPGDDCKSALDLINKGPQ